MLYVGRIHLDLDFQLKSKSLFCKWNMTNELLLNNIFYYRMSIIESTVSYRMVFPTFLLVSVLVATWAKMSFIASEASLSFLPRILSRRRILTCKKGSLTPLTSCSGEYPPSIKFFNILTKFDTIYEKRKSQIITKIKAKRRQNNIEKVRKQ